MPKLFAINETRKAALVSIHLEKSTEMRVSYRLDMNGISCHIYVCL